MSRAVVAFNDGWRFHPGRVEGDVNPGFDDSAWHQVRLPHTILELPLNGFDETAYQFESCYRRSFEIDDLGRRTVVRFDGVMASAEVWCNGVRVGEHFGGYTPFSCELTDHLRPGADNLLAVVVDASERSDVPPFGHVLDYLTYGGIYREVQLEQLDAVFVANLAVRSRPLEAVRRIGVEVFLDNAGGSLGQRTVRLELAGPEGLVAATEVAVQLTGAPRQQLATSFDAAVRLWGLDDPVLYTLTATLLSEGVGADAFTVRTGFRDAEFAADGFHLNGQRVTLRGLNRHQSFPYVGYAMPARAQARDAEILAELGVNLVRSSHYPASPAFLNRCDELGLLVFEEIPGWQHIGGPVWKQRVLDGLAEMIERDWNRPSIVLWGVRVNESVDDDELYTATNALAHRLDPTRQTGGVRNFEHSTLLEDVYTYNDFSHRGDNAGLLPRDRVAPKNVPYLVTEHNGHMFPTKKFDNEQRRTEHALRHLRVLDAAHADARIAGAIGWCLFDYNTHSDFGSGDKICYHGVLDAFRLPKPAAAAYASQSDARPVLEVSSSLNPGEYPGASLERVVVFTNCESVRLYKNRELIGEYLPDRAGFPNLPHPPVVIDDLIGNQLETHEGFARADAERIKAVFRAVTRHGDKSLPLRYRALMGVQMLRQRLTYDEAVALYTRYVADWGGELSSYRFEGITGGQVVASRIVGPASSAALLIEPDDAELIEADSWDATRVVLRHVDDLGNQITYSTLTAEVRVTGAAERIGPSLITLTGGSTAFWIRSLRPGTAEISVRSELFGTQRLSLQVRQRTAAPA